MRGIIPVITILTPKRNWDRYNFNIEVVISIIWQENSLD